MVYPAVQMDAEVTALQHLLGMPRVHVRYARPRPLSNDEEAVAVFSFVLTSAVWVAISLLMGWHVYLSLTAQACPRRARTPNPEPCMNPAPCTLRPAPCTLHPAPCTLRPDL